MAGNIKVMPLGLPFDMVGLSRFCGEQNTREAKMFFWRGLYDFLCVGVLLTKDKVVCTTLCTYYIHKEKMTENTLKINFFLKNAFVPLYRCTISSMKIRHQLYFQNNVAMLGLDFVLRYPLYDRVWREVEESTLIK